MSERKVGGQSDAMGQRGVERAWAPASFGNFFHGFDSVGLALAGPRSSVTVRRGGRDEAILRANGNRRRIDPEHSISFWAVNRVRVEHGTRTRLHVEVDCEIPLGVGLGSSAAMAVAAAKAMRQLLGESDRPDGWWCQVAFEAERHFGGDHWDNVHPAFYGGLTVRHPVRPEACLVRRPPRIFFVVGLPGPALRRLRRDELPQSVPRRHLAHSLSAVAWAQALGPSASFAQLADAIGSGPVESARAAVIPYFGQLQRLAEAEGARVFVCGGGPAICAAAPTASRARRVERRWRPVLGESGGRVLHARPLAPMVSEGVHGF